MNNKLIHFKLLYKFVLHVQTTCLPECGNWVVVRVVIWLKEPFMAKSYRGRLTFPRILCTNSLKFDAIDTLLGKQKEAQLIA